jgi:heme exporter protein C
MRAAGVWLRPALWAALVVVLWAALWMTFMYAPDEPVMRMAQRIFYVHVPAAFAALLAFLLVGIASAAYLRGERLIWDQLAASAAELGVLFSAIVLVTGPMWAKPVWGAYWRWEPRLTSTLILFSMYVAYLMVRQFGADGGQFRRAAAVMGIVAFANIPLVYFSVRLWAAGQQLHPQRVELDPKMGLTLIVALLGFGLLFGFLLDRSVRLRMLADDVGWLQEQCSRDRGGGTMTEMGP